MNTKHKLFLIVAFLRFYFKRSARNRCWSKYDWSEGDFSPVIKYVLIDLSDTIIVKIENIIREEIKYKKIKNHSVPILRSKL